MRVHARVFAAIRPVRSRKNAHAHVCVHSFFGAFTPCTSFALRICARVIFELVELLFLDHVRQYRCAAVAALRVHGCVRFCHVRSRCFCVRSCCLLFQVHRHAARRVGSRALARLLRPRAHSFLEILATAVSAPWRLLLISAADSRATLSRGGSAGGRRRGERTGAAESERARTRADGRRSERPSLARCGPERTRVDCTRETRRRARVRYVRHYVATLCAGRDFPFG